MKKSVILLIMMVAYISMWAQPIERDYMRCDLDRQLEQASVQLSEFQTTITPTGATPAGGIQQPLQSTDNIFRTAQRSKVPTTDGGNVYLGNVTKDKLMYSIFQFSESPTPVATLIGWVDSNDYYPNIVVPDEVEYEGQSVPVTAINDYCFYNGWGITGVTIGKNVLYIGAYSFYLCSITELSIPDFVNVIGNCAFCYCSLNSIVFENPSSLDSPIVIGAQAFGSTNIKTIEIPARLKVVDDFSFRNSRSNPFQGCSKLETITINPRYYVKDSERNFTLEINQGALCERIKADDTYPEYLAVIAYPAARPCEEFTLTAPVVDTYTGSFTSSRINKVTLTATSEPRTINDKVSVNMCIDYKTFDFSDISSLNLSANGPVTLRAPFALFCNYLYEYNLSESITNLKVIDGAICAKKDGEPYLVSYPPGRTETSYTVPDNILHLAHQCFETNIFIKEITLPYGLKSIGYEAFAHCTNLERLIYLGNSLESIGDDAFAYTNIISSAPQGEVSLGNWLIGYKGDTPSNLVISETINNALPEIFSNNSTITSVTFPQDFENIPYGMFQYCANLKTVKFPNNLKTIGSHAFYGAGQEVPTNNRRSGELQILTIPDGVIKIESYAFAGSRLGDKLVLPSSINLLGNSSLSAGYEEVEIHRSTPPENEDGINEIFNPGMLAYSTLIIPKDADPLAFTQNPYWNFSKVINGDFASIDDVEIESGKINVSSSTIFSTNGENFTLYATDGRIIGNGNSFCGLNPGIYIVHFGTSVGKYVIR